MATVEIGTVTRRHTGELTAVAAPQRAAVARQQTQEKVTAPPIRPLDRRSTPPHVVSGAANAFAAWGTRLVPKRLLGPMAGRLIGFEG